MSNGSLSYGLVVATLAGALTLGAAVAPSPAKAAAVTPDIIFGSGNLNGGFTVDTENNIELGLRAKQRFPAANIFNYDGDHTYHFATGEGDPGRPIWNFEWSVNSNQDGHAGGANLSDYYYLISIDTDPGPLESFVSFDPVNLPFDNAIGTNSTGNGGGVTTSNPSLYSTLVANNNVAQNSWWIAGIDPFVHGDYRIELSAYDGPSNLSTSQLLASVGINVVVTPIPGTLVLMLSGLAVIGFCAHRRTKAVTGV